MSKTRLILLPRPATQASGWLPGRLSSSAIKRAARVTDEESGQAPAKDTADRTAALPGAG
jgi:hypothetical protein